jgi:hypothetical protein
MNAARRGTLKVSLGVLWIACAAAAWIPSRAVTKRVLLYANYGVVRVERERLQIVESSSAGANISNGDSYGIQFVRVSNWICGAFILLIGFPLLLVVLRGVRRLTPELSREIDLVLGPRRTN